MTSTVARAEKPEPPVYDLTHRHSLDDIVGYDVIHATWPWKADSTAERWRTTITVTAVIRGATNYATALELARKHRARPGSNGYAANRYACGCREIAHRMTSTSPQYVPPIFVDVDVNVDDRPAHVPASVPEAEVDAYLDAYPFPGA